MKKMELTQIMICKNETNSDYDMKKMELTHIMICKKWN